MTVGNHRRSALLGDRSTYRTRRGFCQLRKAPGKTRVRGKGRDGMITAMGGRDPCIPSHATAWNLSYLLPHRDPQRIHSIMNRPADIIQLVVRGSSVRLGVRSTGTAERAPVELPCYRLAGVLRFSCGGMKDICPDFVGVHISVCGDLGRTVIRRQGEFVFLSLDINPVLTCT